MVAPIPASPVIPFPFPIPFVGQTRCGVCDRPVQVLARDCHVALIDQLDGGDSTPHRCPDDRVASWKVLRRQLIPSLRIVLDRRPGDRDAKNQH